MRHLVRSVAVVCLLAFTIGCKGEGGVTGPVEDAVAHTLEIRGVPERLALVQDSARLEARVLDAAGRVIGGAQVRFEAVDSDVWTVEEDGTVYALPDTVYFRVVGHGRFISRDHPDFWSALAAGEIYRPLDRDQVPASPGPVSGRVRAVVVGAEAVADTVSIERFSPTFWGNLSPSGVCMAVGTYSGGPEKGEPINVDMHFTTRDIAGRETEAGRVEWRVEDPSIAALEVDPDDSTRAKAWGLRDGKTEVFATHPETGISDGMLLLASEKRTSEGNVTCKHL